MQIVERVCQQDGVDAEWLKEYILKRYQTNKSNKVPMNKQQEIEKLLRKAMGKI